MGSIRPFGMSSKTTSLLTEMRYNGHSMVGALQRVVVCSPATAGWDQTGRAERWRELGFLHAPAFAEAHAQHETMRGELELAGAEVVEIATAAGGSFGGRSFSERSFGELSLDAVYAHDASLATDFGLILMRPGKSNRGASPRYTYYHLYICDPASDASRVRA